MLGELHCARNDGARETGCTNDTKMEPADFSEMVWRLAEVENCVRDGSEAIGRGTVVAPLCDSDLEIPPIQNEKAPPALTEPRGDGIVPFNRGTDVSPRRDGDLVITPIEIAPRLPSTGAGTPK